jgi:hypothetical protein
VSDRTPLDAALVVALKGIPKEHVLDVLSGVARDAAQAMVNGDPMASLRAPEEATLRLGRAPSAEESIALATAIELCLQHQDDLFPKHGRPPAKQRPAEDLGPTETVALREDPGVKIDALGVLDSWRALGVLECNAEGNVTILHEFTPPQAMALLALAQAGAHDALSELTAQSPADARRQRLKQLRFWRDMALGLELVSAEIEPGPAEPTHVNGSVSTVALPMDTFEAMRARRWSVPSLSISPLAILESARKRLESRRSWLHTDKDHDAETVDGIPCDPCDPLASRWDAHGALLAAGGCDEETREAVLFLVRTIGYCGGPPIAYLMNWHDNRKRQHGDVLRALDRAILHAKRAEGVERAEAAHG